MTLPTDPQEIFNRVCAHLVGMKQQSMRKNQGCAYRGNDGLKCAIGCLIPDDRYSVKIEGEDIWELCDDFFSEWKENIFFFLGFFNKCMTTK